MNDGIWLEVVAIAFHVLILHHWCVLMNEVVHWRLSCEVDGQHYVEPHGLLLDGLDLLLNDYCPAACHIDASEAVSGT